VATSVANVGKIPDIHPQQVPASGDIRDSRISAAVVGDGEVENDLGERKRSRK